MGIVIARAESIPSRQPGTVVSPRSNRKNSSTCELNAGAEPNQTETVIGLNATRPVPGSASLQPSSLNVVLPPPENRIDRKMERGVARLSSGFLILLVVAYAKGQSQEIDPANLESVFGDLNNNNTDDSTPSPAPVTETPESPESPWTQSSSWISSPSPSPSSGTPSPSSSSNTDNINANMNTDTEDDKIEGGGECDCPEGVQSGGKCECVLYYQCSNETGTYNTDGVGLIDIREDTSKCPHYMLKCCKPLEERPKPTEFPDKVSLIPEGHPSCGHRNERGVGVRITGDEDGEAQFGEFPWHVAIIKDGRTRTHCGGALLTPQVVLTAAHCVKSVKKSKITLRAGEWDTQTVREMYRHQDRGVLDIIIHPEYYGGNLHNDVALILVDRPFKCGGHINTICMPEQGETFDEAHDCVASGWGKDKFGKEGQYQVILKKVALPIVPREVCQRQLQYTGQLKPKFHLHHSFVCAGGELGRDTCKGDGGSPLVCPSKRDPEVYQLIGLVAWGLGCGEENVPGVYVNVALFRHWIDNQLKKLDLQTATYEFESFAVNNNK